MVPRRHATQRREHALAIGQDGFIATRRNILSDCAVFGLGPTRALAILDEIEAVVEARWKQVLLEAGLSEQHLSQWAGCFVPLAESLE